MTTSMMIQPTVSTVHDLPAAAVQHPQVTTPPQAEAQTQTKTTAKRVHAPERSRTPRPFFPAALTFSPAAWLQLQFICHAGDTEIGAFGIAARDDPFHVVALGLPKQTCSCVTVEFDDASVADFFDDQIDRGRTPDQFARVWIHTHPGHSAEPSGIDEETFDRVFGRCDWAIMFILAKGGATTCRLRITSQGVKDRRFALDQHLNVRVAWEDLGDSSVLSAVEPWWFEYLSAVQQVRDHWGQQEDLGPSGGDGGRSRPPTSGNEQAMLDWFDALEPDEQRAFLDDMRGDNGDDYERRWSEEFEALDDRDESFSAQHHADWDERSDFDSRLSAQTVRAVSGGEVGGRGVSDAN